MIAACSEDRLEGGISGEQLQVVDERMPSSFLEISSKTSGSIWPQAWSRMLVVVSLLTGESEL